METMTNGRAESMPTRTTKLLYHDDDLTVMVTGHNGIRPNRKNKRVGKCQIRTIREPTIIAPSFISSHLSQDYLHSLLPRAADIEQRGPSYPNLSSILEPVLVLILPVGGIWNIFPVLLQTLSHGFDLKFITHLFIPSYFSSIQHPRFPP